MTDVAHYDTTINIIGGLRDCDVICKAIAEFFNQADSGLNGVSSRSTLNLRTEKSTARVELAVRRSFLQFYNQDHNDLIRAIFQSSPPLPEMDLILFWQFALNNRLFRDISLRVFTKAYFSGRANLSKEDIIAYLKELLAQNKSLNLQWSESTIDMLSTKYLNFMTKLNFLDGARTKSFRHIKPSAESLVLFLYFAKLHDPENSNLLSNEMLPLSFVALDDLQERLKKLSLKGFFYMNYNGVALNIELTHSYQGICDALFD